ncbi:MAG: hypothetical protein CL678_00220 [Bdellovibrionaceae bacterium]|nr:hypothetical protein [Pseudobdellovibrionaceae bacterium]|tara:strand:- start:159 stop:809 length:651 start_codon:yes stop_codon:yes gene_type:complete
MKIRFKQWCALAFFLPFLLFPTFGFSKETSGKKIVVKEKKKNLKHRKKIKTQKKINSSLGMIQVNLAPLVLGGAIIDLTFAVSEKLSIGGSFGYAKRTFSLLETKLNWMGARAEYGLTGKVFESSWYVASSFHYVPTVFSQDGFVAESDNWMASTVIGYRHFFEFGGQVGIGLGGAYINIPSLIQLINPNGTVSRTATPGVSGFIPWGEVTLGFTF